MYLFLQLLCCNSARINSALQHYVVAFFSALRSLLEDFSPQAQFKLQFYKTCHFKTIPFETLRELAFISDFRDLLTWS